MRHLLAMSIDSHEYCDKASNTKELFILKYFLVMQPIVYAFILVTSLVAIVKMNVSLYDLPTSPPVWDSIGIFYLTFCLLWTTLVVAGAVFCWFNRRDPVLRIRGLPLSFAAIAFLHAYWILAQVVYPLGRSVPTILAYDIQYFFMGIWFPLGIALFHASNCRFLHVAELQKQYANPQHGLRKNGCNGANSSWLCRLRNMSYSWRILIIIAPGMLLQVSSSEVSLTPYLEKQR